MLLIKKTDNYGWKNDTGAYWESISELGELKETFQRLRRKSNIKGKFIKLKMATLNILCFFLKAKTKFEKRKICNCCLGNSLFQTPLQ